MSTWLATCAAMMAADFQITSLNRLGALTWSNAFSAGVCTIESAPKPFGPWQVERNYFTTGSVDRVTLTAPLTNRFFRALAVDISASAAGFSNLVASYGKLHTVAGSGSGGVDGVNYWLPEYEGAAAAEAVLSRPHFAMADRAGNIFIVDKDSHSVLKISPDGNLHTVAGTHEAGDNGDGPAPGTSLQLSFPNGEWVRADGAVFILDTGNGKVRQLDTNGTMTTLFTVNGGITTGRGLWVSDDATLAYFASGKDLKQWTPGGGVKILNSKFKELGNLVVEPDGHVIATDRGAHRVYRVSKSGNRTAIAGNGNTGGGGDGSLALDTGLAGVRGVWLLPNGGYLLATHAGSQIWYVDGAGIIRLFLDGLAGNVHDGDGDYFYSPGFKIAEARSVTLDYAGNILITENDRGYVRRIDFQRLQAQ